VKRRRYRQVYEDAMRDRRADLPPALRDAWTTVFWETDDVGVLAPVTAGDLAELCKVGRTTMFRVLRELNERKQLDQYLPKGHPGWVQIVGYDELIAPSKYALRRRAKTVAKWERQVARSELERAPTLTRSESERATWGFSVRNLKSHSQPPDLATNHRPDSVDDLASVHPLHERRGDRGSQQGGRSGSVGLPRAAHLAAYHVPPRRLGLRDPRALGDILDEASRSL
jgi:hypothetical protein